jgi:RNA polymerase sigma factor (TIGR02999 family)
VTVKGVQAAATDVVTTSEQAMSDRQQGVTRILQGDVTPEDAWAQLLPLVYDELKMIAQRRMIAERGGHTLQATALVHEAYMRLVVDEDMSWSSRRHFFGAAAEAMRRVLVDHARKVKADKRGGDRARVSLSVGHLVGQDDPDRLLALDEALGTLAAEDPRAAEVARLRYFAGLTVADTALALDCSERTVMREWTFARARLSELLGPGE